MLLKSANIQQNTVLLLMNRHFSGVPSSSVWMLRHPGTQLGQQNCCDLCPLVCAVSLAHLPDLFQAPRESPRCLEQMLMKYREEQDNERQCKAWSHKPSALEAFVTKK